MAYFGLPAGDTILLFSIGVEGKVKTKYGKSPTNIYVLPRQHRKWHQSNQIHESLACPVTSSHTVGRPLLRLLVTRSHNLQPADLQSIATLEISLQAFIPVHLDRLPQHVRVKLPNP